MRVFVGQPYVNTLTPSEPIRMQGRSSAQALGSNERVPWGELRRAPDNCHSVHHLCGRKQGVPDVKPFKHDEVVVYNDGAKFQVRNGLTWQCYGAFAVVYRRRGIVLERRVWKAKYVSSANRPIKVVLCDLQLSIVANEAADESTVYVPILLSSLLYSEASCLPIIYT